MAMRVADVRLWLAEFDAEDEIAIDDGGLALVSVAAPTEYYIEIGGIPEDDDETAES